MKTVVVEENRVNQLVTCKKKREEEDEREAENVFCDTSVMIIDA